MARLKREGVIETLLGAFGPPDHQLRHATVAEGIGVIGPQPDGAFVQSDRLFAEANVQERIAEIGQGDRTIRLQRDGLLLACPGVLEFLEVEIHGAEIAMGVRRARIERNRALEQFLRLLKPPALIGAQAEHMRGVEMIRNLLYDPAAERLGLRKSALPESLDRDGHDGVRLLPQLLLQSRILKCARADSALQGLSPEDGPKRGKADSLVPGWRARQAGAASG